MSLPAGRDAQKGKSEVQNITWDFGDEELGPAFPWTSSVGVSAPDTSCELEHLGGLWGKERLYNTRHKSNDASEKQPQTPLRAL